MPNQNNNQNKWEVEFDEEFPCIEGGDNCNGTIQVSEDDIRQCQFHAEYLFPIKSFLSTSIAQAEQDGYEKGRGEPNEVSYEAGKQEMLKKLVEIINNIPVNDISMESDNYDAGLLKMSETIINLINTKDE